MKSVEQVKARIAVTIRMMQAHDKRALLFDDAFQDIQPRIRNLYRRAKTSLLLTAFLKESICSVNVAADGLHEFSAADRKIFLANDFLRLFEATDGSSVARSCVRTLSVCVLQLGSLIL